MPVLEEKETEKLFYAIGEVAGMFDVNTSLIRFWEKEFDVISPTKNKKGNRLFTKKDIESFRLIYHLVKEKGYTLQGAKDKMKGGITESDETKAEVVDKLKKIKSQLLKLKEDL
jgi:DNA-binding transcriptional MerR regulator